MDKLENCVLSCSGGETSMDMVLWCLENWKDKYNMLVVFANTGQEHDRTYDFIKKCVEYYKIPLHCIEARVYHNERKSTGFKRLLDIKDLRTSKDWRKTEDTPFEQVVIKYGIPNHSRLHCTRELKMNPIKAYAKYYFKGEKYKLTIGLRTDEMDRINPKHKEIGLLYPLITDLPSTKKHVNFRWSLRPFRLELKGYEGNCITCFKKSNNKLNTIAKEQPEAFSFFDYIESKYGNIDGNIPLKGATKTENYKNVFFRGYTSTTEVLERSKTFDGFVVDDHVEVESCEIFSGCGDEE